MRLRTTVILAILAAALGAFYVVFDLLPATRLSTTEELSAAGQVVFSGPPFRSGEGAGAARLRDLITRLEIERRDGHVVLERAATPPELKWRLLQPILTDASPGESGFLCYELETLKIKSLIKPATRPDGKESPLDLAAYGLDNPQARIRFTVEKPGEAAAIWTLLIGKADAEGQAVYVKREDQNVICAVAPALMARASKSVNELRDPAVVSLKPEDVTVVELRYAGPESVVRCELKNGAWRVTKPVADYADEGRIGELLSAAAKLRIKPEDYVSETDSALGQYGLDKPRETISIRRKDETVSLLLGADVEGKAKLYARRADRLAIFALEKRDVAAFTVDPSEIRSLKPLHFNPGEVSAIELDLPSGKVTVTKAGDVWRIESPMSAPADAKQVSEFLSALERVQVAGWVDDAKPDLAKYGLTIPLASVTLTAGKNETTMLRIGMPVEGFVYGRRDDGGPLLRMKSDILELLMPGYLAFVEKRLHLADGTITALTIERADGKFVCVFQDKVWRIDSPARAPADQDALRTITWNSSFLSAERFIEQHPKDLAKYGLDKPSLRLTITCEKAGGASKETTTKTVLIGKESTEGFLFAMIEGSDAVITVAKDAVGPFEKPLFALRLCAFDSAKVNSLAVEGTGRRLRVARQAGTVTSRASWVRLPPEQGVVDDARVKAVLDTLSALKAESVVAITPGDSAQYGWDKPTLAVSVGVGDTSSKLVIGTGKENGYYANTGGPLVYLLKPADVEKLMSQSDAAAKE